MLPSRPNPGLLTKRGFPGWATILSAGFTGLPASMMLCFTARIFSLLWPVTLAWRKQRRVFDNQATAEASRGYGCAPFLAGRSQPSHAHLFTPKCRSLFPLKTHHGRIRNPVLRRQKGLLSKIWLSGHNTNTLGGLDAFDTVENALDFAINEFPKTTATMNAAFYTRVFDARVTEAASRGLNSPYYL